VVGVRFNDSIISGRISLTHRVGAGHHAAYHGTRVARTYVRAALRGALPDGSYRVSWQALYNRRPPRVRVLAVPRAVASRSAGAPGGEVA
jgi:hypothetical protein